MEIKELIKEAYRNSFEKGFWEDYILASHLVLVHEPKKDIIPMIHNAIGNRLMGIVGELAEAQQALRNKDNDNFKEELADVALRLFSLCGGLGIDLEAEIHKKMEKNKERPWKHGKSF